LGASRPTPRQSLLLKQATAYKDAPGVFGDGAITKDRPDHRSTSGLTVPPGRPWNPTARQNVDAHDTPENPSKDPAGFMTGARTNLSETPTGFVGLFVGGVTPPIGMVVVSAGSVKNV
jgi:hypothetical protein